MRNFVSLRQVRLEFQMRRALPFASLAISTLICISAYSVEEAQAADRATGVAARAAAPAGGAAAADRAAATGASADTRFQAGDTAERADGTTARALAEPPCQDCDTAANVRRQRRNDSEADDCRRPRVPGQKFVDPAKASELTRCDRPTNR